MKHLWKRGIALALAGTLCLSMAACGKKGGDSAADGKSTTTASTSTLATELGYGYLSEYKDLDVNLDYIGSNNISTAGGKLYFAGDVYEDNANQTVLYCVDPATGETSQIPTPTFENTDTTSSYVQNVLVAPDASSYWLIVSTYTMDFSYDVTEEGSTVTDDAYAATESETRIDATAEAAPAEAAEAPADTTVTDDAYGTGDTSADAATDDTVTDDAYGDGGSGDSGTKFTAYQYDMSGNVLSQLDLSSIVSDSSSFYPQYAVQDKNGDLYLADDTKIYCIGSDGTVKATIEPNANFIMNMTTTGDGTVVLHYFTNDSDNNTAALSTIENGTLSDPITLTGDQNTSSFSYFPGSGNTLMASDGTYLYSVDLSTGTPTKVLSWLDSDINASNLSGIAAPSDDTILVLTSVYHMQSATTYELGILTKTPADQLPKRTILTLGAEYLDDSIRNAVIAYNRKSNDYRITMVNYGQYNTEDDYTKSAEQLDRDVISGNCPDLIFLSTGHEARYISKGALADMSALMEKDSSISTDDLVSSALIPYTSEGKLYGMPYALSMQTLIASAKLVGDRDSWTLSDLSQIIDGLDEGTQIMTYTSQNDFLNIMVSQNMSQFVDFGAATCNFDSDDFKQLLSVAAKLPTQDQLNQAMDSDTMASSGDEYSMLQSGDLLMTTTYVSGDSYSLKELYGVYTRDHGMVRIGYPLSSGNGANVTVSGGLAISAKSKNIDAAWDFVKTMLSDDVQQDTWNIPVTKTALDAALQKATVKDSYVDENGETQYYDQSTYIGDTEYTIEPLTQEQVEDFKAYLDGASCGSGYDSDIMSILSEESAAFFSGDKTADDVAKLIQNRVSIYLGEIS